MHFETKWESMGIVSALAIEREIKKMQKIAAHLNVECILTNCLMQYIIVSFLFGVWRMLGSRGSMSSLVFELMVAAVVALAIIFVLLGIIFKR